MDLRWLVSGSLVLGLALAGCAGSGDRGAPAGATAPASAAATAPSAATTAPSAAPDQDARAALTAAARKLGNDSMRFRLGMGQVMKIEGIADPATGAMQMSMHAGGPQPMSLEMRHTGKDVYLKFGGAPARSTGSEWLRIKGTDLPPSLGFGSAHDPGDAQRFLRAITQVDRAGALGFRGTLDLTKSPSGDRDRQALLKVLGAKARAVPFTALVDAQGRLVGLAIRWDAAGAPMPPMTVRYFDFGTPVAVSKPAGRATDVPKAMVEEAFGG